MNAEPEYTVAMAFGEGCAALRGTHTAEALARAVTNVGLNWSSGRVAHLEQGKVSPTVTTLLVLARAFAMLLDRPVTIAELFAGDGSVPLGNGEADLSELRAALSGDPVAPPDDDDHSGAVAAEITAYWREFDTWPAYLQEMPSGRHRRTASTWLEADDRAVADLGVSPSRAFIQMAHEWGQSLSAQRDQEAGPDANQQQRGRISRRLIQELREAIADGDDH